MEKKIVTFGEVMLRLATPGYQRYTQANSFTATYGGAEANVAVSLANYGMPTEFVTRLPLNDIGRACLMELRRYGVGTDYILFGNERMGIYFLETGAVARASKVIYDRDRSAMCEIKEGMVDWHKVFENAAWFHWTGITPAISMGAAKVCLEAVTAAKEMGVTVSCDINYRKNLWNYGKKPIDILPALVEKTDIVLANEEDCQQAFGIKPKDFDVTKSNSDLKAANFVSVCDQMQQKFPNIQKMVITLRGSINANHNTWSGLMYNHGDIFQSHTYDITHIVDRVGGGDSFMGGLIYGLNTYGDDKMALEFATAASCLKHTIYGDFNQVTVAEVEKLMNGDASGRVSR